MCKLFKINKSMNPITTESSNRQIDRQTDRHNSSAAFVIGRTLKKKLPLITVHFMENYELYVTIIFLPFLLQICITLVYVFIHKS